MMIEEIKNTMSNLKKVKYRLHSPDVFIFPEDNVSFNYSYGNVEPHEHTFYEFFLIINGTYTEVFNNKAEQLTVGNCRLVKPGDKHFFIADSDAKHVNFAFTEKKLKDICDIFSPTAYETLFSRELSVFKLSQIEQDFFINQISQFSPILEAKNYYSNNIAIINLLIVYIVTLIQKRITYNHIDTQPDWFAELLSKINSPTSEILYPQEVYAIAACSPPTLIKYFKKYTGKTIAEYLNVKKISEACSLLTASSDSILSIAFSIGFNNLSHFNKLFKSLVGCTPTEYRKQQSNPTFTPSRIQR